MEEVDCKEEEGCKKEGMGEGGSREEEGMGKGDSREVEVMEGNNREVEDMEGVVVALEATKDLEGNLVDMEAVAASRVLEADNKKDQGDVGVEEEGDSEEVGEEGEVGAEGEASGGEDN